MNTTKFYDRFGRRIKITRIQMKPIYDLQIQNDEYLLVSLVRFIYSVWMLKVSALTGLILLLAPIRLLYCSSFIFI